MRRKGASVVKVGVAYAAGLGVTFALGVLLPGLDFLSFMAGFLLWLGVVTALAAVAGRRWVVWCALPAAALTGIGTLMLAEDIALRDAGTPTAVVVTADRVDVHTGSRGTTYTHHYTLRRTDGRPLGQEMVYRGRPGYAGARTGARITVLVDPAGRAPVRPADDVDVPADATILVLGGLGMAAIVTGAAVSVRPKRPVRT
ncbi:MAG TPA: hypothetical protein VGL93_34905 [Streptosporangiaceae bacterium]